MRFANPIVFSVLFSPSIVAIPAAQQSSDYVCEYPSRAKNCKDFEWCKFYRARGDVFEHRGGFLNRRDIHEPRDLDLNLFFFMD